MHLGPQRRRPRCRRSAGDLLLHLGQRRKKFTRHTIADRDEHIALGRQFAVEDLNDDGRLDLVAPSKTGLWVLMNLGID